MQNVAGKMDKARAHMLPDLTGTQRYCACVLFLNFSPDVLSYLRQVQLCGA